MTWLALGLIKLYQNTVSRALPDVCRFQPTCSHYAVEAIRKYGLARGSWLAAKRIARCNPFCEGGYDPVP
ncbi:MAG TPA: membrane protein insertion efficiency factor YidD [Dehalococcoidia bacterium]|nr:membrane protein insertion efficiency factor YidD [Dehalococcoidia bacterium]